MSFYEVTVGAKTYRVELTRAAPSEAAQNPLESSWRIRLNGREMVAACLRINSDSLSLLLNGESFDIYPKRAGDKLILHFRGKVYECSVRDPRSLRSGRRVGAMDAGPQEIKASMPGKVVRILAKAGEPVEARQGILVIEAMKMQNEVRAPKAGLLKKISAREGANVNAGDVLATIE
ncbi:MAG TPA: biotin/lipoyl-containing protein [Terriglobales bacterium]|nr:biotin/lipoyl-containing protein [Terriglobales bacterium]